MIMNKTVATFVFDGFNEELLLGLNRFATDDVEMLKENALDFGVTVSSYSFDGENIFPQLFQTLNNEPMYFDVEFRLRVALAIEKCRSMADALGNLAMLLELMQTHYPKEKEVGAIDVQTSA